MPSRDRDARTGHSEVAERLAALVAGERSGWVPTQRSMPPASDDSPPPTNGSVRPLDRGSIDRGSIDTGSLDSGLHDTGAIAAGSPGPMPRDPAASSSMALASLADRLPPWAQDRLAGSGARTALVALVAVAVLAVGGVELVRAHGGSSPYPAAAAPAYPVPAGATPAALAGAPDQGSGSIVVDVSGRVRKPGLVTLPSGARVADAIGAAGGPTRPRDIRTVDLAAKVGDGQLLLVGESGTASAATGSTTGSTTAGPVDLSSATLDQLETIPGVGPVTAQKIIDFRSAHNGFSSVSQLQQVPGIGPAKYAEISPLVIS